MQHPKNIFVSYKRKDYSKVRRIIEEIERHTNAECWFDLKGIEVGDKYQDIIIKAIEKSSIVLCFVSQNYISSFSYDELGKDFIQKEISFAIAEGKRIVPITLDGTHISDSKWLQFHFEGLDCIDYRDKLQRQKLFNNINDWNAQYQCTNENENSIVPSINRNPLIYILLWTFVICNEIFHGWMFFCNSNTIEAINSKIISVSLGTLSKNSFLAISLIPLLWAILSHLPFYSIFEINDKKRWLLMWLFSSSSVILSYLFTHWSEMHCLDNIVQLSVFVIIATIYFILWSIITTDALKISK